MKLAAFLLSLLLLPRADALAQSTPLYLAGQGNTLVGQCNDTEEGLKVKGPCLIAETFGNGVLRARFPIRIKNLSTTLVIHGEISGATQKNPGKLNGLALEINGLRARFVVYKNGKASPLESYGRLLSLPSGLVEVKVSVFGSIAIAEFVQADRPGQPVLGTVATLKAPTNPGHPGIASHTTKGWMTSLTMRNACTPLDASALEPETPQSDFVLVFPPNVYPRERPGVAWLENRPKDEHNIYRFDTQGLESVFCEGQTQPPVGFLTELPWKYLDRHFMVQRNVPPTRTTTGIRTDLSYKDPAMIEEMLKAWHALAPDLTRLEKIGTSHEGRPLWAIYIGEEPTNTRGRPTFLFNGAHHGSEVITVEFVIDLIGELLNNRNKPENKRIFKEALIVAVPVVNPDSLDAFFQLSMRSGRKNRRDVNGDGRIDRGEGVDLNRNYPFKWGTLGNAGSSNDASSAYYRGKSPASEPEVQAMVELGTRVPFTASISYHSGSVSFLVPYTINGMRDPKPNEAWSVANALTAVLPHHPENYTFRAVRQLYPVDGTDQDWHRFNNGTLAYILEGAIWAPVDAQKRIAIVETVRPAWRFLVNRFLDGPSISISVHDEDGNPVKAEIRIAEQDLRSDEHWHTRCSDGTHHRYVAEPGVYTIIVKPVGQKEIRRQVDIQGHATLDVKLPGKAKGKARCLN